MIRNEGRPERAGGTWPAARHPTRASSPETRRPPARAPECCAMSAGGRPSRDTKALPLPASRCFTRDNWNYREQKSRSFLPEWEAGPMLIAETPCDVEPATGVTPRRGGGGPTDGLLRRGPGCVQPQHGTRTAGGRGDLLVLVPATFPGSGARQCRHRGRVHRRQGARQGPGDGAPLRLQHRHSAQGGSGTRIRWSTPASGSPCNGCTGAGGAGRRKSRG